MSSMSHQESKIRSASFSQPVDIPTRLVKHFGNDLHLLYPHLSPLLTHIIIKSSIQDLHNCPLIPIEAETRPQLGYLLLLQAQWQLEFGVEYFALLGKDDLTSFLKLYFHIDHLTLPEAESLNR